MDALDYTRDLVAFGSVSSVSNVDICDHLERTLKGLEFETERIDYVDDAGVKKTNVVGKRGTGRGGLAYIAHTDVVPADNWFTSQHGPFVPTVKEGRLYGRGSSDMKGSLGCALAAAAAVSRQKQRASLYITGTADEEVGYTGAAAVAKRSALFRQMVGEDARGIIGEPTELEVVYAHKGTYGFRAVAHGRAAHSSSREGINANLAMIPFLVEMKAIHDDTERDPAWQDDRFDPPTISWNIGINDNTRAVNITPPQSVCTVYFRPMPNQKPELLVERARAAAKRCGIEFQASWSAPPLAIEVESEFVGEMLGLAGKTTARTVCYGTDGTQLTALKKLVVIGPGNIAQGHTHDEWIDLKQLERGTEFYARCIERFCC
jgi:acetylornithine deacetylase